MLGQRSKGIRKLFGVPIFTEGLFEGGGLGEPTRNGGAPGGPNIITGEREADGKIIRKRSAKARTMGEREIGRVMRNIYRGREERVLTDVEQA